MKKRPVLIEANFSKLYPNKWMPLYSQVTFSNIRYSEALKNGKRQSKIMDAVMRLENIEEKWESEEVINTILEKLDQ